MAASASDSDSDSDSDSESASESGSEFMPESNFKSVAESDSHSDSKSVAESMPVADFVSGSKNESDSDSDSKYMAPESPPEIHGAPDSGLETSEGADADSAVKRNPGMTRGSFRNGRGVTLGIMLKDAVEIRL